MKFSPKRVLTAIAIIGLFAAALARGEYLLGTLGIFLFAALSASAIALTINLMLKWRKHSIASKFVVFVFVGFVVYTIIFPMNMWPDYQYFAQTRQWQRNANKLQTALTAETDYRDVRVNYNAPPNSKSEFLDVRGDVPILNAYDRLVNRVESMDTWYVMWSVTVGGNEMPEPTR